MGKHNSEARRIARAERLALEAGSNWLAVSFREQLEQINEHLARESRAQAERVVSEYARHG